MAVNTTSSSSLARMMCVTTEQHEVMHTGFSSPMFSVKEAAAAEAARCRWRGMLGVLTCTMDCFHIVLALHHLLSHLFHEVRPQR